MTASKLAVFNEKVVFQTLNDEDPSDKMHALFHIVLYLTVTAVLRLNTTLFVM
jgi:hypothetical protein